MDSRSIDDYLLDRVSEAENEKFEERLLADDDLFYAAADRENELVDAYIRGDLDEPARHAFERTLARIPARKQKVENARALRQFVESERGAARTITIAERTGFIAKIGHALAFGSPAFQFASIGLILLLVLVAAWLLMENRRMRSIENELAAARAREADLTSQIQSERDATGDLAADLSAERGRIQQLEEDLRRLGRSGQNSTNGQSLPPAPTIATLLLSPVEIRGGSAPAKRLEIPPGVDRVAVSMIVDDGSVRSDPVAVRLNGETVASGVRIRDRGGRRSASVTLPVSKIKPGRNEITLTASDGSTIVSYPFLLADPQ